MSSDESRESSPAHPEPHAPQDIDFAPSDQDASASPDSSANGHAANGHTYPAPSAFHSVSTHPPRNDLLADPDDATPQARSAEPSYVRQPPSRPQSPHRPSPLAQYDDADPLSDDGSFGDQEFSTVTKKPPPKRKKPSISRPKRTQK